MDMTHPGASKGAARSRLSGRVSAERDNGIVERMGTEILAIALNSRGFTQHFQKLLG